MSSQALFSFFVVWAIVFSALIYGIVAFVFSEGTVHHQQVHDYDYDEVEHEHYWRS